MSSFAGFVLVLTGFAIKLGLWGVSIRGFQGIYWRIERQFTRENRLRMGSDSDSNKEQHNLCRRSHMRASAGWCRRLCVLQNWSLRAKARSLLRRSGLLCTHSEVLFDLMYLARLCPTNQPAISYESPLLYFMTLQPSTLLLMATLPVSQLGSRLQTVALDFGDYCCRLLCKQTVVLSLLITRLVAFLFLRNFFNYVTELTDAIALRLTIRKVYPNLAHSQSFPAFSGFNPVRLRPTTWFPHLSQLKVRRYRPCWNPSNQSNWKTYEYSWLHTD